MIVDTSAVLAILLGEPEAPRVAAALAREKHRSMSAVSYLEAAIVLESRKGPHGPPELELLVQRAAISVVPFDGRQAAFAHGGFTRFGKGRHPAALNLGDCCVYALAAVTGEPILHLGEDFSRTDAKRVELPE